MAHTITTTDEQIAAFASVSMIVIVIILLMSPTLQTLLTVISLIIGMEIASAISMSKCHTKNGIQSITTSATPTPSAITTSATPTPSAITTSATPTPASINPHNSVHPPNLGYVTDLPDIDKYDAQPDVEPIQGNNIYVPDVYEGAIMDGDDDIGLNSLGRNNPNRENSGVTVINEKMSAYLTKEVEEECTKEWWGNSEY
jgi:hypothetical protein